ncbi:hypothetical protein [Bacillus sp. 196mf]|uniref:hypothetical protein n=1 Tax=Bacillus sp. 196mf TaxID=1761754 RepID=UPI0015E88F4E|nr:hypothetical protein [Bacillus sp. 196mf]
MKDTRNARIARNNISSPRPKKKKVRRVKGQGGGPKLKNFSPTFRISENDVF